MGRNGLGRARIAMWTGLLSLVAVGLTTSAAHAGEKEEARRHFKSGMEAMKAGEYDKAIVELKAADEILHHKDVTYNIARAYAESGDIESAIIYYRKYLSENPSDKDEIEGVVRTLEARLAKSKAAAAAAANANNPDVKPDVTPIGPDTTKPNPKNPDTNNKVPDNGTVPTKPEPGSIGTEKADNPFAESVVTVSKEAQSPVDAPSSTTIITEQDIRLSGMTNIPDLLSRVAGIDIAEMTAENQNYSIRGFNSRLSNKLLILVDGRSVYLDFLGTTLWEVITIPVENIERIEVVKGPGSALYGADAFAGVVNIITKNPGEGKSGVAVAAGGQNGSPTGDYRGAVWASGREGGWNYRLSAQYHRDARWGREVGGDRVDLKYSQADQTTGGAGSGIDFRLTRRFGKDVNFGIGAGYSNFMTNFYAIGSLTDMIANVQSGDVTAFLTSPHINFRAFWNWFRADAYTNVSYVGESNYDTRPNQNVVDGELEYTTLLKTGIVSNDLHIGVGYRLKTIEWSYLDKNHVENHWSVYAQDSAKIGDKVIVVLSGRGDYVPYLQKVIPSPRGSVIIKRSQQDSFRLTVSSAFRTPSYLESYINFPLETPNTGAFVPVQAIPAINPSFRTQPERIVSAEIGYINQTSDYYAFDLAAYYNRVTDLIVLSPDTTFTPSLAAGGAPSYDPASGKYVASYGGWVNDCQIFNVFGGEASARAFPVTGLDFYASYAINYIQQSAPGGCTGTIKDQRTSHHKVIAGAQVRTKYRLDGSLDVYFESRQQWAEQTINFVTRQIDYHVYNLDSYPTLQGRLGYRFEKEPLEVAIVGMNLLNTIHRDHPFGQQIGRKVYATATYKF